MHKEVLGRAEVLASAFLSFENIVFSHLVVTYFYLVVTHDFYA